MNPLTSSIDKLHKLNAANVIDSLCFASAKNASMHRAAAAPNSPSSLLMDLKRQNELNALFLTALPNLVHPSAFNTLSEHSQIVCRELKSIISIETC